MDPRGHDGKLMWAVMVDDLSHQTLGFVWLTQPSRVLEGNHDIVGVECESCDSDGFVDSSKFRPDRKKKPLGYTILSSKHVQLTANMLLRYFGRHRAISKNFETFHQLWITLITGHAGTSFFYSETSLPSLEIPVAMIPLSYRTAYCCDDLREADFDPYPRAGLKIGVVGSVKSRRFNGNESCSESWWAEDQDFCHERLWKQDLVIQEAASGNLRLSLVEFKRYHPRSYICKKVGKRCVIL